MEKSKEGKLSTKKFDTRKKFKIRYDNEIEFNKLSKSLKTYNMIAYKEFIFCLMSELRAGKIIGEKVEDNIYKCHLHSSKIFEYVFGETYFTYRLEDENAILMAMEPKEILLAGHAKHLGTYKGVPISSAKDKFKVDLYYSINKNR